MLGWGMSGKADIKLFPGQCTGHGDTKGAAESV